MPPVDKESASRRKSEEVAFKGVPPVLEDLPPGTRNETCGSVKCALTNGFYLCVCNRTDLEDCEFLDELDDDDEEQLRRAEEERKAYLAQLQMATETANLPPASPDIPKRLFLTCE